MLDSELLNTLQSSGIIDGYEYTLRRLIEANLPTENVYEKCAYFLLEYQKLILDNNIRSKGLQDFVMLTEKSEKKIEPIKFGYTWSFDKIKWKYQVCLAMIKGLVMINVKDYLIKDESKYLDYVY